MAYLIGIDLGTSGAKTALFEETGRKVCSATHHYPMTQPQNGWVEQDPEDWWNAVLQGLRDVLAKGDVSPKDIMGIGLSGQMHGLVMLGWEGKPLRSAIIWCDQRTAEECADMTRLAGADRLMAVTACPAMTGFTASKILWVRKHQPDVYEKCRHILLPKDYIRYCLTGEFATDVSDASGMQLLDIGKRTWSEEITDAFKIDRALLAQVYESPEITGGVSSLVARETGLRVGTPVVGGAGDNAAAAVGTGAVRDGRAFATIGTSGVVFMHTDQMRVDPKGRVHTFCCAVPGAWHVMGVMQSAGLSLNWFKDACCGAEKEVAAALDQNPYDLITAEAALSPIGANRLLYLPYLMGERTPHLDPYARGAFIGLSAMHGRRDMIRAVLEGVSYALKDSLTVFEELTLRINPPMALCGGGARSALWKAMLADVFGLPVRTVQMEEGPALGAALLAGVGAGLYGSVPEACDAVITYGNTIVPDALRQAAYVPYYDYYRSLYPALKEPFAALAKL